MADSDDQSDDYPESRPLARCGHIACAVDRFMIIWGGYRVVIWDEFMQEEYLPTHEIWIYDTDTEIWFRKETQGRSPKGTSGAAATVVDNKLYIFGGFSRSQNVNQIHCLDLKTLRWVNLVSECAQDFLPSPRDKHSVWDYKNKLYVFGGFGPPTYHYLSDHGQFELDASTTYFSYVRGWNNQILEYDIPTHSWKNPACSGMAPSPRAAMAVAKLDDRVVIFGGRNKEIRLNDLHYLDLDGMSWTQLTQNEPIPVGRTWHTFSKITQTELFMYGGFTQEKEPLSSHKRNPCLQAFTKDIGQIFPGCSF
ncbi:kelch domain-containing protein 2-like isoform X2 [Lineus longissimus]|uniref:kelch domain-containing protein 2-like isoform X2 n=1 Tax=Lineus longissimus TaxID=88925 RepID=UPI002B4F4715